MGPGRGHGVDQNNNNIIFFINPTLLSRAQLLSLHLLSLLLPTADERTTTIDAIKDLDPKRKCFRLIGGVLVERTVEEVLPAVEKNRDGLSQVIEKITEQRDQKMEKVDELQKKYKIRVKGEPEPTEDEGQSNGGGQQGVLA